MVFGLLRHEPCTLELRTHVSSEVQWSNLMMMHKKNHLDGSVGLACKRHQSSNDRHCQIDHMINLRLTWCASIIWTDEITETHLSKTRGKIINHLWVRSWGVFLSAHRTQADQVPQTHESWVLWVTKTTLGLVYIVSTGSATLTSTQYLSEFLSLHHSNGRRT